MIKTLFTTERGQHHQQAALQAAPDALDITMLREPEPDDLLHHLRDAVYWISERLGAITAEHLQAAPELKLILRLGSLTYDIDLDAAKAAGVSVCYWPVGGVIRVAEHLMMQMLALSKKLREVERIALDASTAWRTSQRTDEDTFAYNWSNRRGIDGLWRKTIGIVGFGEIGVELARRLRGWDCRVLYNKRSPLPDYVEDELGLTYADADALYAESDFIVNLLPYFPETDMLINANAIDRMKDGVFVVSAGSGSVIDETALAAAVASRKVAGAALDTYEWEPILPDNPLIALAKQGYNVLLTPHTAAGAVPGADRAEDYTMILHHMRGEPLRYRVV